MARTIRVRNPHFEEQRLNLVTWTRIVRGKFPEGRDCSFCGKLAKHDEMVITVPARLATGKLATTVLLHKTCLVQFLDEVPDQLSVVEARVQNITKAFLRD